MKHGLFKRSLSMVLALVMILGNLPLNALATETEETAAPCEHSYESVVTDATCTEGGYTTHTCSLCGETYTDGETAALGHAWGDWAVTTEATAEAEGEQTRICDTCGAEEKQAVARLEPAPTEAATEPAEEPAEFTDEPIDEPVGEPVVVQQQTGFAAEDAMLAVTDAANGCYWDGDTLYIKNGSITKGNLYAALVEEFGSASYKYAESKPSWGWGAGGSEVKAGDNGSITVSRGAATVGKKTGYTWTGASTETFTVEYYYYPTVAVSGKDGVTASNVPSKVFYGESVSFTLPAMGETGWTATVKGMSDPVSLSADSANTVTVPNITSADAAAITVELKAAAIYNVNLTNSTPDYGTASVDKTSGITGTTVTVTVTPREKENAVSYALGSITVNGTPIVGNTFTIGEADADVVVTFTRTAISFGEKKDTTIDWNGWYQDGTKLPEDDLAALKEQILAKLDVQLPEGESADIQYYPYYVSKFAGNETGNGYSDEDGLTALNAERDNFSALGTGWEFDEFGQRGYAEGAKFNDINEKIRITCGDLWIETEITLTESREPARIDYTNPGLVTYETADDIVSAVLDACTTDGSEMTAEKKTGDLPAVGQTGKLIYTVSVPAGEKTLANTRDVEIEVKAKSNPANISFETDGTGSGSVNFGGLTENGELVAGTYTLTVTPSDWDGADGSAMYVDKVEINGSEVSGTYSAGTFTASYAVANDETYTITITYGTVTVAAKDNTVPVTGWHGSYGTDYNAALADVKAQVTAENFLNSSGTQVPEEAGTCKVYLYYDGWIGDDWREVQGLSISNYNYLNTNSSYPVKIVWNPADSAKYPAVTSNQATATMEETRTAAVIGGIGNDQSFPADTEAKFEEAVKGAVSVTDNKGNAVTDKVAYDFAKQEDGTYTVTITASNQVAGNELGGEFWTYATETYTGIQWVVNEYSITFRDEDGKLLLAEKKYPYGTPAAEIVLPEEEPSKVGHTFEGWSVADVTEDVTYTASYTVNKYSITWKINDEAYGKAGEFDYGTEVTAPAYTVPEGHTFSGWDIPATMPAENLTLNATLTVNEYDIVWIWQNAEGQQTTTVTLPYGIAIVVPAEIPAQYTVGNVTYTRTGWTGLTDGATVPVDGKTYTATYTEATAWIVDFDSNGGTEVVDATVIVPEGETAAVAKPADPTREGYRFDGWYLDNGEYDFTAPVTSDITLTAKWVKQVTVSFEGAEMDSQTFDINGTATKPADPGKEKAIFGGWYLNGEEYDFTAPVTEDITLTANWLMDINENGADDALETITITVSKANEADNAVIRGEDLVEKELSTADGMKSYIFDSTKSDASITIVATPVVNGDFSITYVAGVEGAEGTGTYGTGYAYTYLFTPANGQKITVNFAEAEFVYNEERVMNYHDKMTDVRNDDLYNTVVDTPDLDDDVTYTVTYKAREAMEHSVSIDSLDLSDMLKRILKTITGKDDFTFDMPDLWLEVDLEGNAELNEKIKNAVSLEQAVKTNLTSEKLEGLLDVYNDNGGLLGGGVTAAWNELQKILGSVTEAAMYYNAHVFGYNATDAETVTEEIKVTYKSSAMNIEGQSDVTLKDLRAPSYMIGSNVSAVYKDYTDEELAALIGAYAASDAAGASGIEGAEVVCLDITDPYTMEGANVSDTAYKVTFRFDGDETYKPSQKTFDVTIQKASLSMDVPDVIVTYGETYSTEPVYTMGNKYGEADEINASLIRFLIGLDLAELDANADGVTGLAGKVQLMLTPELQDLLNKVSGNKLEDGMEMSLSDLTKYLELINDDSLGALKQALDAITGITEAGDITITLGGKYPVNVGAYLYGAVTTNANYETAFDVGYIVIKPDAERVYLDWNYTDSNGIFTAELLKSVNLGASAFNDEAFAERNDVATAQVQNLFFGIDADGELAVKLYANDSDPELMEKELGYGAYTQLAFIAEFGNELYYAVPVIRAFAMVPSVVKVDIIVDGAEPADLYTTEFDNEPVDVTVTLSSLNIDDPYEVTYHYYGIEGNTHTYDSDVAPTHTGAYLVTASAVATDEDGIITAIGMDAATLVIKPTESTVTMKELETVEYSGAPVRVSETMEITAASTVESLKPDTTVITAGITTDGTFSENAWEAVTGTVNVDFPRWVDELIAKYAPSVKDGITVSQLKEKLLNKLPDISAKLEEVGATNEIVNSAANLIGNVSKVLEQMPGDVELSFQDDYAVNTVGVYAVVAVVTDSDHIPSTDAGLLVVAPAVKQVYLDWNHHDENGIWSRELLKLFDLYASAYEDKAFEILDEAATEKISHKFIGLESGGELKIYDDPGALSNGAYVELAYIALEVSSRMTLSDIIARPIVIVPNDAKLQIVDNQGRAQDKFEFVFDNAPVELYVQQDGKPVARDIRYIGLQTNGVQYDSTTAPTHAGLYAAYTVQIDQELVGVDVALVTIAPAVSAIDVTGGTVTYDGNVHIADVQAESPNSTVTSPDYTLISGNVHVTGDISEIGVDAFRGNVNIDFPDWLDKAMKEYDVIAYNKGVDKDYLVDFFTSHGAAFLAQLPAEELVKLGFAEADITAAIEQIKGYAAEMLALLEKMPEDVSFTFKNKEALNYTEPGYYFYYGIVTDSDHIPASDTGLLVIEKMDMKFGAWHEVVPYDGKEHTVYVPNDHVDAEGAPAVDYVTMIVDRENNHVNFLLDADLMYAVNAVERILNIEIPAQISIAALCAKLQEYGLTVEDFADALIQVLDAIMAGMEVPETPKEYAKSTYRDLVNIKEVLSNLPETGTIAINGKKPVDVGQYEFYIFAFSEYYKTQDASAMLFIEPITVRVDDEADSKIYGETDPELTAEVRYYSYVGREDPYYKSENYGDEYIRGGKFDKLSSNTDDSYSRIVYKEVAVETLPEEIGLTYDVVREEGEDVGTYPMSVENAVLTASGNYALEVVADDTVFTIYSKTLTAEDIALDGALTYNGDVQTQNIKVSDGITCDVTGNTGTDAGQYTMTVTGTGNYTGTVELPWTIAKAKVTVTIESDEITYGDDIPAVELTYSNDLAKAELNISMAWNAAKGSDVGTYGSNFTWINYKNWIVEYIPGELTIKPKTLTDKDVVLGDSLTYDGTEQTMDVTAPEGAVIEGNQQTDAGTYELTVTMPEGGNYTGSITLEWTIDPKPVIIVVKDVSAEEGEEPVYSADVDGVIGDDDLGLSFVCIHDGKPGTYEISAEITNPNYTAEVTKGTLTITEKENDDQEGKFQILFEEMEEDDEAAGTIAPNQTVEIDGVEYPLDENGELWVTEEVWNELVTSTKLLTTYTYNKDDGEDPHTIYPTAMYVWVLTTTEGDTAVEVKAERIEQLDNYLMYEGTSIRISTSNSTKNAIRFFTSIVPNEFKQLKAGTLLDNTVLQDAKLSVIGTRARLYDGDSNLNIGNSTGDVVFGKYEGDDAEADGLANSDGLRKYGDGNRKLTEEKEACYLFTGALENIPMDKDSLNKEIMFRPFAILQLGDEQITLYGGKYQRSVAYVALQNEGFMAGTAYNKYIQEIISTSEIKSGK